MQFQQSILMPNELFQDMKEWLVLGELKSIQHQEFIYAYYWLLAYLWRYGLYLEKKIGQPEIKSLLNYSPNEKRLNYIIKRKGLLNVKGYTSPTSNYPVSWELKKGEELKFTMLHDFNEEERGYLSPDKSRNFFVQSPLKHLGDSENEGIYWNQSNTHLVSGSIFDLCMKNRDLGCAGFYLFGLLVFIRDKCKNENFLCANKTLMEYTGWGKNKVYNVTCSLSDSGLISKEQSVRKKGSINEYVLFDF